MALLLPRLGSNALPQAASCPQASSVPWEALGGLLVMVTVLNAGLLPGAAPERAPCCPLSPERHPQAVYLGTEPSPLTHLRQRVSSSKNAANPLPCQRGEHVTRGPTGVPGEGGSQCALPALSAPSRDRRSRPAAPTSTLFSFFPRRSRPFL